MLENGRVMQGKSNELVWLQGRGSAVLSGAFDQVDIGEAIACLAAEYAMEKHQVLYECKSLL